MQMIEMTRSPYTLNIPRCQSNPDIDVDFQKLTSQWTLDQRLATSEQTGIF